MMFVSKKFDNTLNFEINVSPKNTFISKFVFCVSYSIFLLANFTIDCEYKSINIFYFSYFNFKTVTHSVNNE